MALMARWDALTAIGTLALAVVTAAAVIVTLVITHQDRKRDRRLEQDQQASDLYEIRTASRPQTATGKQAAIATFINGGDYTVTHVIVRFSIAGQLTDPQRAVHLSSAEIAAGVAETETLGYAGVLTPGTGLRVTSALGDIADAKAAVIVVRWTDRWEQRWEYRQGVPRRIKSDEPWSS